MSPTQYTFGNNPIIFICYLELVLVLGKKLHYIHYVHYIKSRLPPPSTKSDVKMVLFLVVA
jgi:hypothetical protein